MLYSKGRFSYDEFGGSSTFSDLHMISLLYLVLDTRHEVRVRLGDIGEAWARRYDGDERNIVQWLLIFQEDLHAEVESDEAPLAGAVRGE